MTKLHDKKPELTGLPYYASLIVPAIARDGLCALTLLLVVATACALALHERGVDVIPRAAAAGLHP